MKPATITSLDPAFAAAGGPAFTLTINGSDFAEGISTVPWNGSDRPASYISESQMTASISPADIAAECTASVTVFKNAYGEAISNAVIFSINVPVK